MYKLTSCVAVAVACLTFPSFGQGVCESTKLLDSNGPGHQFGWSVSINGDTAIVGAWVDSDNGVDSGAAYVFQRGQGAQENWVEIVKLTASDAAPNARFGIAVSIQGDTAIVGAVGDDDNGLNAGAAYIFQRDVGGVDNWGQIAKLTAGDGAPGDYFGLSVSIGPSTAIVGAPVDDDRTGAVYIFGRDNGGPSNWGQLLKLTGNGGDGAFFARAVSISGDWAVVGAHLQGARRGAAYVFQRNRGGIDNWGQVANLTSSDIEDNDEFGESVAIDGDTVIVGAKGNDDAGSGSGSAYIFQRDQGGANNWGEVAKLTAADAHELDEFGWPVVVNANTVIVGAHRNQDDGPNSGKAYCFQRDQGGFNNWGQFVVLDPFDNGPWDLFGFSVSVKGETAFIGAPSAQPSTIGSVYVFSLTGHDCNENTILDACDIVEGTSEDANGNGVPDECEPCLPADLDSDGLVGVSDLLLLLAQWGVCPPICLGDINGDGNVGVPDLLIFLANWGPCP